jgi:hypothetical protein
MVTMQRYAIEIANCCNLLPMTTLPVARCTNCQVELQPGWKFCIACGTPVPANLVAANAVPANPAQANPAQVTPAEPPVPAESVPAEPIPAEPAVPAPAQPEIPAAIRQAAGNPSMGKPATAKPAAAHFAATGEEPRRRINLPVLTSIVLGTAGLALIIYLLVVVFGSRD